MAMTQLTTPPRKRGRPATYTSDAERARAWRQRQRDLVADAKNQLSSEHVSHARKNTSSSIKHPPLLASTLIPAMQKELDLYGGEAKAKRLRIQTASAANTVRTILAIVKYAEQSQSEHQSTLDNMLHFFNDLHAYFESEFHARKGTSLE